MGWLFNLKCNDRSIKFSTFPVFLLSEKIRRALQYLSSARRRCYKFKQPARMFYVCKKRPKRVNRKVPQGVPQSQTAANPLHQEEE